MLAVAARHVTPNTKNDNAEDADGKTGSKTINFSEVQLIRLTLRTLQLKREVGREHSSSSNDKLYNTTNANSPNILS